MEEKIQTKQFSYKTLNLFFPAKEIAKIYEREMRVKYKKI